MPLQEVKGAMYKYQKVKYCHVLIDPAEAAVLVADPWSFLHGYLLNKVSGSAGNNRKCYTRAKYFSSLAESFYRAAEAVDMPAKGTLLYYGMMNLVKALLSVNKIVLEEVIEHHGISNTHAKKYSLTVMGNVKGCTNIFLEFSRIMGKPVKGKHEISLRHILPHIPELNGIIKNLGFTSRTKYLPVEINFRVNSESSYLMTEVSYNKGLGNVVDTHKFLKGRRKDYYTESYEKDGKVIFRSKRRKKLTQDNWPVVYRNILKEYSNLGFASILTRNGYSYYCSLQSEGYHHLCNAYLLMFYLGHTARYRPTEIEEIMQGEWRPIATEAVSLLPNQFKYQMISLITGKLCVIPYADV